MADYTEPEPTLQSVQYVVAVESGFTNWKALLDFYM